MMCRMTVSDQHDRHQEPVGWLAWPARVIAFCVVLPVRLAWEAARRAGQAMGALLERVLGAFGRAVVAVLRPIVAVVLVPLRWIGRTLLLPVLAALGAAFGWLFERLVLPVGRALVAVWAAVTGAVLAVLRALWHRGLGALLRALARTVGWAWHAAGRALAVLGRLLAWPFLQVHRHVLAPIGHAVRGAWRAVVLGPWRAVRRTTSAALAAVRASVRDARRQVADQVRRALGRPRR